MKLPFFRPRNPTSQVPSSATRRYQRGDFIGGKYEVLRHMEGGLGLVYVVSDGGSPFVLKTPKAHLEKTAAIDFIKEARAWIAIGRHPNIVPAYWVDEIAGLVFVAAELVQPDTFGGVSLRDTMRRGKPSLQQVLRWAAEFCHGMHHAAERGIAAHRDIKPENLLLGASNVLQITDFGLASIEQQDRDSPVGDISGTPQYMAPEQWLGQRQSSATDVYAFGIVLYELCFGHRPWTVNNLADLRGAHLNASVHPPPHPLAELIVRCLRKTATDRFGNYDQLLVALSEVAKRNRLHLPPMPPPLNEEREELFALASTEAIGEIEAARRAAEELVHKWPEYARGWTQLGRILLTSGETAEAKRATLTSLDIDPTRSAPWNNLGLILTREDNHAGAIEAFKRAIDADPDNTGAMLNLTRPLAATGRQGDALAYLRRAAELAPDKHSIWINLGFIYSDMEMTDHAVDAYSRALKLAPLDQRREIEVCLREQQAQARKPSSGSALLALGKTEEAIARLKEELEAKPSNPILVQNLALALLATNKIDDARRAFERLHHLEPTNELAWHRLMRFAADRGDLIEVEHWCGKYAAAGLAGRARAFYAYALEQNGHVQEAKKVLLAALKEHPEETELYVAYGDLAVKNKAPSFALDAYKTALRLLSEQGDQIEWIREVEAKLASAIQLARRQT